MIQIELFSTPRLKPVVETVPTRTAKPAQKHAIKRAVERRAVKSYMARAVAYDEANLRLAREVLAGGREWEPFYVVWAEAVVERLEGRRSGGSGWIA